MLAGGAIEIRVEEHDGVTAFDQNAVERRAVKATWDKLEPANR